MRRLRFLALLTEGFGGRGGIARYNCDVLQALSDGGGLELAEVLTRSSGDAAHLPARVHQCRARQTRTAYALEAVWSAVRRRYDVVFCGHLFMSPLAAVVAWLADARLVVQVHGIEAWTSPSPLIRLSLKRADLVLCVSRDTRRRVLDWATLPPERVAVLGNTVRAQFWPGDPAQARAQLGLGAGPLILSVSRLMAGERYKGQDKVILALPELIARRPGLTYVIVGDGDDTPRLKALACAHGLSDRVVFAGEVEDERLVLLYQAADLFVLPSTGEGFGIVFLEAMACGVPALGVAVGGAPDALGDGMLGWLADAKRLASAIAAALDSPREPPAALSAKVAARFGQAAFPSRLTALLQSVVNRSA